MSLSPYRSRGLIRYGNFMFRYRNTAFPVVLVLLVIAFPPRASLGDPVWDVALNGVALVLAFAGELLRILTVGLEYIKRGGLNKRVYASTLVTNGLFAHCRNPLYTGNVMIAFALLLLPGRIEMLVVGGILVMVTYIAIIAAEEEYLRANFGEEYEAYSRSTNRWLPDPRGLGRTISGMQFNWRRVVLKESSSFYGWITAAFLLKGIESRFSPAEKDFLAFLALFVAASVAFLLIRLMKWRRWLVLEG